MTDKETKNDKETNVVVHQLGLFERWLLTVFAFGFMIWAMQFAHLIGIFYTQAVGNMITGILLTGFVILCLVSATATIMAFVEQVRKNN